MRSLFLAAALAATSALGACATVEDSAKVNYAAHGAPIASAQSIRVSVTATDARVTNRGRISTKKNGYGMDMAAIRSTDDVGEVVRAALADEMKARGYQIASGGPTVHADVKTFYTDFKVGIFAGGAEGTVDLIVSVLKDGQSVFTKDVRAVKTKTVAMASGSNAAAALSLALGDALDQLFADAAFTAALAG